jgi:hypothetical protein
MFGGGGLFMITGKRAGCIFDSVLMVSIIFFKTGIELVVVERNINVHIKI